MIEKEFRRQQFTQGGRIFDQGRQMGGRKEGAVHTDGGSVSEQVNSSDWPNEVSGKKRMITHIKMMSSLIPQTKCSFVVSIQRVICRESLCQGAGRRSVEG